MRSEEARIWNTTRFIAMRNCRAERTCDRERRVDVLIANERWSNAADGIRMGLDRL